MNFVEKKNLTYRLIVALVILLNLGFAVYAMIYIFQYATENKILSIVACISASLMMIFEIIIALLGGKKENALYKIAFNPNGRLNNVPFIAVLVFSGFGLGLTILGTLLNLLKGVEPYVSISFVILVIAVYLLTNCLVYFLYCLMFKKREIKLEDFIK